MKKKLKDVCIFYSGTGFPIKYQGDSYGDLPFYKVGDIANNAMIGNRFLDTCKNYISYDIAKKIKGTVVPKNVIVFAKIGEALKLNRRCITSSNCLIDNNVMGIGCNEKFLDLKYFYFFMKNLKMEKLAESTTVPSVRKTKLEEVFIEVPAMKLQLDISKILGILQDIILHRQNQLVHMDNLVKARFVEIFGDPIINEKDWDVVKLNNACDGIGDGLHGTPKYDEYGVYPFINGNNLKAGVIEVTPITKMVNKETYKKHCSTMNYNTILLSINGTLGKLALYNGEEVMLGKSVCYCNLKSEINREFVYGVMNTDAFKIFLESNATASTIKNVGLKAIRGFKLILPPKELQIKYVDFVKQVNKSKLLSVSQPQIHIYKTLTLLYNSHS